MVDKLDYTLSFNASDHLESDEQRMKELTNQLNK